MRTQTDRVVSEVINAIGVPQSSRTRLKFCSYLKVNMLCYEDQPLNALYSSCIDSSCASHTKGINAKSGEFPSTKEIINN